MEAKSACRRIATYTVDDGSERAADVTLATIIAQHDSPVNGTGIGNTDSDTDTDTAGSYHHSHDTCDA